MDDATITLPCCLYETKFKDIKDHKEKVCDLCSKKFDVNECLKKPKNQFNLTLKDLQTKIESIKRDEFMEPNVSENFVFDYFKDLINLIDLRRDILKKSLIDEIDSYYYNMIDFIAAEKIKIEDNIESARTYLLSQNIETILDEMKNMDQIDQKINFLKSIIDQIILEKKNLRNLNSVSFIHSNEKWVIEDLFGKLTYICDEKFETEKEKMTKKIEMIKTDNKIQEIEIKNKSDEIFQLRETVAILNQELESRDRQIEMLNIEILNLNLRIKKCSIRNLNDVRTCHLIENPNNGYGFLTKKSDFGPLLIVDIIADSSAYQSGLRIDDLILKVNNHYVVGEDYSKTLAIIQNESEKVSANRTLNSNKLFVNLVQVNFYSKNTKSQRKKLPHESKNQGKWIAKTKGDQIIEDNVDKLVAQRQVVDPVWLMKEYKVQTFSIEDAITYHKELARAEMLNNLEGFLHVRFLLDMTSKKKNKFLDNFKSTIYYPHFFTDGIKKEVVAICKKEEEIEAARNAGAIFAGYTDILKKFEKGEITDQSYDFLICTPEAFPDVMLLKKKINKDKLPSVKANTVTDNIGEVVQKLHLSKDYETSKNSDEQGVLKTKIGQLNFETKKLVDNLGALIEKVKSHKKYASETFITSCVLYSPPSTEKFKVDISRFIEVRKDELIEDKEQVDQQEIAAQ